MRRFHRFLADPPRLGVGLLRASVTSNVTLTDAEVKDSPQATRKFPLGRSITRARIGLGCKACRRRGEDPLKTSSKVEDVRTESSEEGRVPRRPVCSRKGVVRALPSARISLALAHPKRTGEGGRAGRDTSGTRHMPKHPTAYPPPRIGSPGHASVWRTSRRTQKISGSICSDPRTEHATGNFLRISIRSEADASGRFLSSDYWLVSGPAQRIR